MEKLCGYLIGTRNTLKTMNVYTLRTDKMFAMWMDVLQMSGLGVRNIHRVGDVDFLAAHKSSFADINIACVSTVLLISLRYFICLLDFIRSRV